MAVTTFRVFAAERTDVYISIDDNDGMQIRLLSPHDDTIINIDYELVNILRERMEYALFGSEE